MNGGSKKGWGDKPFPPGQDPDKVRSTDVDMEVVNVEGSDLTLRGRVPTAALDVLSVGDTIPVELKIGDFKEEEVEEEEDENGEEDEEPGSPEIPGTPIGDL